MQDGRKTIWSIPYVSVAFFPSLKQNFIAYRSSKMSDCIFDIHQLWQSGFSRVYSNCCCRCSFEPEIIKIGQSSHKMYSNNIVNFQEPTTILHANIKKSWNLSSAPRISFFYLTFSTYILSDSFPSHTLYLSLYLSLSLSLSLSLTHTHTYTHTHTHIYIYIYIYKEIKYNLEKLP